MSRPDPDRQRQQDQRRRDRRILIVVALVSVLLVVGGGVGYQLWRTGRMPTSGPEQAATLTPTPLRDGRPIRLGEEGAPRTLTLWVDFHCPGCGGFEDEYGPGLFEAVGRAEVALEVYPMSFHDAGSRAAANGFACAAEAGFPTAYYRGLFANRDLDWNADQLIALAELVVGEESRTSPTSPSASMATCVRSDAHGAWVDSITAAADRAEVRQTPTVWLDGDPVDLTVTPPDMLLAMIDQEPTR